MFSLVIAIAAGAYLGATWGTWRHLRAAMPLWPGQAMGALALALHLAVIVQTSLGDYGLSIGVGGALSLFAWQAALLLLFFSLRQSIAVLGLVVYPIAGLCLLAGIALPAGNQASAALDWPLQAHVLLSLLAYGLLTLGAVQALVLAAQHRQIHEHQPRGLITALPPLQSMEQILFRLLATGFFLLTLAIASGAFFIDQLFAQHLAHKTVLSIIAWLFFAVLLWGRWRYGWRGRVAVRWTLGGYGLLILAYFGSKLVLELILGEHW